MSSDTKNASRWLGKKIIEAKGAYLGASTMIIISAVCFVAFSWYLSGFAGLWLDEGLVQPNKLIIALSFLTGRYLFSHFASILNFRAGNIIVARIKKLLYPKLLKNNQNDSIKSTLLVTRAADDLKPFYSFFIPYAMASVMVGILLMFVIFSVEKWVGFVLLISFLVIPLQMIVIGIGAESLHKKHINLFMKYSAVFYNRLHTIAEIVNLDNLKSQFSFLSKKSNELNSATTSVMRVAILSSAVLELFVTLSIAGVAIYLGMSLLGIMPGPNYGVGYDFRTAMFLLTISPYFFFYLRKFVSAYHDRNRAVASAQILIPVLDHSEEAMIASVNDKYSSLEIKNLNFSYPDSVIKVLHNIHLSFPSKGLVLVKGISGSGKSTLLKILTGSLNVTDGTVSINGNNNLWSQQWLWQNSSYMNQYPFVFDGTLQYNVLLEEDKEIPANYPDFLNKILYKKEDGWQAVLSHNGKQLSGGEKQMLTLARMMLFPKQIAILDEPTANLDAATVEIILEQIVKMADNQLVIVASHEDKFDTIATITLNLNWGEQMDYE